VQFYILNKPLIIIIINFRANLDAQNAGNCISGLQISKIFWGVSHQTPLFMLGMSATHGLPPLLYPLIYYLTERSLFKKCPPKGKSLKKALYLHPGKRKH
jgi:hypothetical protein